MLRSSGINKTLNNQNMKIKIKVTKDILERSKMCGKTPETRNKVHTSCAIALAIRDIFPQASVSTNIKPFFYNEDLSCDFRNRDSVIRLPEEAVEFIDDFDESTPEQRVQMNPIEFEVEIPDCVVDQISIEEITRIVESSPTLELV